MFIIIKLGTSPQPTVHPPPYLFSKYSDMHTTTMLHVIC